MNAFICVSITVIMFIEWATETHGWLPNTFKLVPDALSVIAAIAVLALATRQERFDLPTRHVIILIAIALVIIAGFAINEVPAFVMINGLREYLKHLPFFLIPVLYRFSEQQLRFQFVLLLIYCMFQPPVALYQRFILYDDRPTGDLIGGTLGESASGIIAVFLSCVVAVIVATWVRRRLSFIQMIFLVCLLMVPASINLTTISAFVYPFAFAVPVFMGVKGSARTKRLVVAATVFTILGFAFVSSYNYFKLQKGRKQDLITFLGSPDDVASYLYEGGSQYDKVKRLDAVRFGFQTLSRDGNLIFGIGAGNASPSPLPQARGEYHRRYWRMAPTRSYFSRLIWEVGLVGTSLFLLWMAIIWRDALRAKESDSVYGTLALSWVAITPIVGGSFVYFGTFDINVFSYFFMFYSGIVVAEAHRPFERQVAIPKIAASEPGSLLPSTES